MVSMATIKTISMIRMMLASIAGHPFKSILLNLLIPRRFLLINKIVQEIKTVTTRNSINEVLGTLITSKLGFISPETFEVLVAVNNISTLMLFQEDSQKELLERNYKREGPIFEGDESLISHAGDFGLQVVNVQLYAT